MDPCQCFGCPIVDVVLDDVGAIPDEPAARARGAGSITAQVDIRQRVIARVGGEIPEAELCRVVGGSGIAISYAGQECLRRAQSRFADPAAGDHVGESNHEEVGAIRPNDAQIRDVRRVTQIVGGIRIAPEEIQFVREVVIDTHRRPGRGVRVAWSCKEVRARPGDVGCGEILQQLPGDRIPSLLWNHVVRKRIPVLADREWSYRFRRSPRPALRGRNQTLQHNALALPTSFVVEEEERFVAEIAPAEVGAELVVCKARRTVPRAEKLASIKRSIPNEVVSDAVKRIGPGLLVTNSMLAAPWPYEASMKLTCTLNS